MSNNALVSESTLAKLQIAPGSFRDPSGRVFTDNNRIFRHITKSYISKYEWVQSTGLFSQLVSEGCLLPFERIPLEDLVALGLEDEYVVEVPRLPCISFPYEWSFSALKNAALLHLSIHIAALKKGVTLSDASAYNVQFQGARPVFIDHLSFRPYVEGEVWGGHRQFCEQFLNPLLLRVLWGIPHNAWYRGTQEGIPVCDLRRFLKWKHYGNWKIFIHVVMQDYFRKSAQSSNISLDKEGLPARPLPLSSFFRLLENLHHWISSFTPADWEKTLWCDYVENHAASSEEIKLKKRFVREFVSREKPNLLWDFGCNIGEFSEIALEEGAGYVVGFDADHGVLERGYARAEAKALRMQMLYMDAANPSPSQGWMEQEREGLQKRAGADGVLALAFIHHLAIARNIPLQQLIHWIIALAPRGVIEFVPKSDPMVQRLLRFREDIFPDYTENGIMEYVGQRAEIVRTKVISKNRRMLIEFQRFNHS